MPVALWLALLMTAPAAAPAEASPVGKPAPSFVLTDTQGRDRPMTEWSERRLLVLVFLRCDCPVVKLYAPRLAELAREFEPKGVGFVGINTGSAEDRERMTRFCRDHNLTLPILEDATGAYSAKIGARRTPEVFLLDAERVVRYRGRIDDQYAPGLQRPRVGRRDLAEAIGELLAGKAVSVAETEPAGCLIDRPVEAMASKNVTYTRDVAAILQKHCIACHQPGQAAPFSLTDYASVSKRARRIRETVEQGRMPPWLASPEYGHFKNENRLSAAERKVLFDWIDSGTPEGDPRDLPPLTKFAEGWRIPEPNLVLSMPEEFTIPAEGKIDYQYYEVDPGFQEDHWVQMAEVRPSNRAVVHHGMVYLRPPGTDILVAQGDLKSIYLAAVGPGSTPLVLPEGRAKRIPAGWRLVFQLHYVTIGSEQKDKTCVGLVFADPKKVKQEVATNMAAAFDLKIPPRVSDHVVEAKHQFGFDVLLLSFNAHMHLRGSAFRYEAEYPDGRREPLLDIPRYDFNWQNTYQLAEPKRLPAGTVMHCIAHFDNSEKNPVNPDPNAEVKWGTQSEDEMMIGYFDIVRADEDLTSWRYGSQVLLGKVPVWGYALVCLLLAAVVLVDRRRRRSA
jgi:peroxiredoxin/mono/diheme cytochrome c family protein